MKTTSVNKQKIHKPNPIKSTLVLGASFTYLRTGHKYHLVDPSPWPVMSSVGVFTLVTGIVAYMHGYSGGWESAMAGLFVILVSMIAWWKDVVREATFENRHSQCVRKGLRLGMLLFLLSEAMFFFAFFWAFFHSSVAPTFNIGGVWPPVAISTVNTWTIPLTNTLLLLTSGATVTWAHHAVLCKAKKLSIIGLMCTLALAGLFSALQAYEYISAPFFISDGIYGSCFYMTTGLHGLHVFIGGIALGVALARLSLNHFTNKHHFGLESAIWYWHFVDVVWLVLYLSVYCWGNS